MSYQDHDNIKIFEDYFVNGEADFSAWLSSYLSHHESFPFQMGGLGRYDLGDLLRALLPPATEREQGILQVAFEKELARTAEGFDLETLRALAHAAARSGFDSVTPTLSRCIEITMGKLAGAQWGKRRKAAACLAVDQIIAALGRLAYDYRSALRVAKVLFRQGELAPFASSLFGPLALDDIERWPDLWAELLEQAVRPAPLFGRRPHSKWAIVLGGQHKIRAAHFDVLHVFRELLYSAAEKGFALQDIYDAASSRRVEGAANPMLVFNEMERLNVCIRRHNYDSATDEIYLSGLGVKSGDTPPTLERRLIARVAPKETLYWGPGSTRRQLADEIERSICGAE